MNYFHPYPLDVHDDGIRVWQSQAALAAREPSLRPLIAAQREQLFPAFITAYRALRQLPRGARRALQRRFVRSDVARRIFNEPDSAGVVLGTISHLARSLAGIALLVALEQANANGATINVTTSIPKLFVDGRCSLPEAIINANTDAATHPDCGSGSGADTIALPANSTHQVTTILASYHGATGLPLITSAITIEGNGGRVVRPTNKTLYRLMAVTNSGDLTLKNLRLQGGLEYYGGAVMNAGKLTIQSATVSGGRAANGGGIFNAPTGTLTITDSTLTRHAAVDGGAVFNFQGGTQIQDSTISTNQAVKGGGVSSHEGVLVIENSTITGNRASDLGGGVHGRMAAVEIKNSIVSRNSADTGGGVLNYSGVFNIENCLITSNRAFSRGGGTETWNGEFTIESSTISMNTALSGAGVGTINFVTLNVNNSTISKNIARYSGGGLESWAGRVTINKTTISNNRAGDTGGGLAHFTGPLAITNSTISGNSARREGGGAWTQGPAQISNSTITGNSASEGGGILNITMMAQLFLERSLIAGNKAVSGQEVLNRLGNFPGTVTANDFNLIGASDNPGIFGFSLGPTDRVPSVPVGNILAPLADNGGLTPTHALVAGSPAVDVVPGAHPECSGTDQRDIVRPQGFGCDSGSFEK